MVPDAEILKIAVEVLEGLGLGEFTIKVIRSSSRSEA